MDEHERNASDRPDEEVKLPDERVEDLEPDTEDAADVKGGWWKKVEDPGDGGGPR